MGREKIGSNEDLVMIILLGLPVKSVFRFRCVSKTWNNVVADPFFIQTYEDRQRRQRPISPGVILWRDASFYRDGRCFSDSTMKIMSLTKTNDPKMKRIAKIPEKFGYFIHSSNGLILCGMHHYKYYHVLNPLNKTCVSLPPPPCRPAVVDGRHASMGLVWEENTRHLVPSYKVVLASIPRDYKVNKKLSIQTYSSKTRAWTSSTLLSKDNFEVNIHKPLLVFKGVLHWHTFGATLAVYDSNVCDNHVQLINLPIDDEIIHFQTANATRSSNGDVLWLSVNRLDDYFQFWMLPKGHNSSSYRRSTTIPDKEWILMHTVSHFSLSNGGITDVCVELLWFIPGNPLVAVLRVDRTWIYLYNLETNSVESVLPFDQRVEGLEKFYFDWDQYTEPVSLSSYALSPKTY